MAGVTGAGSGPLEPPQKKRKISSPQEREIPSLQSKARQIVVDRVLKEAQYGRPVNPEIWKDITALCSITADLQNPELLTAISRIVVRYLSDPTLSPAQLEVIQVIKHLDLSQCYYMNDDEFIHIIENCPYLESLEIDHLMNLSAKGFEAIAKISRLKSLKLKHVQIKNNEFLKIVKGCPNLQSLDILVCRNLTMEGLQAITELTHLKSLNLNIHVITPEIFEKICSSLPELEELEMNCLGLAGPEFRSITKLSHLKYLNIGTFKLSPEVFKKICESCRNLEVFIHGFGLADSLSDEDCRSFMLLTKLTKLTVSGSGITGPTLMEICKSCPNLKKVLAYQTHLTFDEMEILKGTFYNRIEFLFFEQTTGAYPDFRKKEFPKM